MNTTLSLTAHASRSPSAGAVLVFDHQDSAIAFMQQLEARMRTCAEAPSEPVQDDELSPIVRYLWAVKWIPELGDYALGISQWSEAMIDATDEEFLPFPGGEAQLWVRQGNVVALAGNTGEHGDDPLKEDDALASLMPAIEHVLEQL